MALICRNVPGHMSSAWSNGNYIGTLWQKSQLRTNWNLYLYICVCLLGHFDIVFCMCVIQYLCLCICPMYYIRTSIQILKSDIPWLLMRVDFEITILNIDWRSLCSSIFWRLRSFQNSTIDLQSHNSELIVLLIFKEVATTLIGVDRVRERSEESGDSYTQSNHFEKDLWWKSTHFLILSIRGCSHITSAKIGGS